MLRMEMTPLVLGPDEMQALGESIWPALLDHLESHPPRAAHRGVTSITVSEAKDILKVALPHYRGGTTTLVSPLATGEVVPRQVGQLLHHWIHASVRYFRRAGAQVLRRTLDVDEGEREQVLWAAVFDSVLLGLVQGSALLAHPQGREACDLAVESLKLWVRDISGRIGEAEKKTFAPGVFFLDTEGDLDAVVEVGERRLHVRGRPDALLYDQRRRQLILCEYKFGSQSELEIQIAQVLMYVRLIEAAKSIDIAAGELQVFRARPEAVPEPGAEPSVAVQAPESEFPRAVDEGFRGFVGNRAAVRRLKIECTLALRGPGPIQMPVNLMFSGPAGLGKTELARRVARTLDLPFTNLPAGQATSIDALMGAVDRTLADAGIEPIVVGRDSGRPLKKYPPFVLFLDEIHELRRRTDAFLTLFEPAERRAVGGGAVGDISAATILGATTDRGKLAGPLLSRFRMVDLEPYMEDEVAELLQPLFPAGGLDPEFLTGLARIGRLTPRVALERAREVLTRFQFDPEMYPLTTEGLRRISAEQWGVDENGLGENDRRYLRALRDGPRGQAALASLLPVGREEVERLIEPFLLQIDAIRITSAGRVLTERGRMLAPPP
ncbi:MAG: AAA family ATPase [Acidobacteriota bacterium]